MKQKTKFKTKLRKDDLVEVMAGKDRGKRGKVLQLILKAGRAIVEGANVVQRHVKPSQKNPQGGILSQPAPIHLSNLMAVDPNSGKPSRIGKQKLEGKSIRIAKRSGKPLDDVQKGK